MRRADWLTRKDQSGKAKSPTKLLSVMAIAVALCVCAGTATHAQIARAEQSVEEKVEVPAVTKEVRAADSADAAYAQAVTVKAGDVVEYRVTGTLTSVLDQYLSYHYAFEDTHPAEIKVDASSVRVTLQTGSAHSDITDLFTVQSSGTSLAVTTKDLLKARGVDMTSKVVLTYAASVAGDAKAADYDNFAHVEHSSIYDPHRVDSTVEASARVTVKAAKKASKRKMPSTGDRVIAAAIALAVAGGIVLMVGACARRSSDEV